MPTSPADPDAADTAVPPAIDTPKPPAPTPADTTAAADAPVEPPKPIAASDDARYLLQAGAFAASGDAEALKAKIAFLGLSARVESAQIYDKTVYRVRMGPYGTAIELAEANLKKTYVPKLSKAVPAAKVARYIQIENKIRATIRYQLAEAIPLVK